MNQAPGQDPSGFFDSDKGRALILRIEALPGRRVLVAVAGAPGSGKSTLAAALVARLPNAALVPLDGFHLDDRVLEARAARSRKGAVDTFDAEGFVALTDRLRDADREVVYPVFDRGRELAIAGAGVVAPTDRVVVIEGNYLLLDQQPWSRAAYDLTILLDVSEPELRRRLQARWQGLGKDAAATAAHLANDLANARHVMDASRPADLILAGADLSRRPRAR